MNRRQFLVSLLATAGLGGCGSDSSQPIQALMPTGLERLPELSREIHQNNDIRDCMLDKTLLRYHFTQGEELRWNVRHMLKMRNIIGGKEENIETRTRAAKIWKTLNVDANGAATFEYRVEDIDLHQAQTGHDDIAYNSFQDKNIPPELSSLQGKIGVPLAHIKIEPQGQTTRKPLRDYTGSISENRIVIPLPDEPAGIASRWSELNDIELPLPNHTVKKIRARDEFILESIHSGLATIRFSTLIFTPLTPKDESQLLDHFTQGTMELDLQAGYFIRYQATADRLVVGVQDASDSIRYLSRITSCCCGRRTCEICTV